MSSEPTRFVYEKVAAQLEDLIEKEVFRVGDRLPSVRELREQYGISISTALQVYSQLQRRGLVESREKSGYFVQFARRESSCLKQISHPDAISRPVSIDEMVAEIRISTTREDLINLSMPVPPPELLPVAQLHTALTHTIRAEKPGYLRYQIHEGDLQFRRLIAQRASRWGGLISESDVVVTNGCMEAIRLCLEAVARPGDTIITESPTFYGLLQTIQYMNLKVLEMPTDAETGLCIDQLSAVLKTRRVAACLLVNSFNNPLGSCMPDEKKMELVTLLARHEIPLIEDDVYGELHFGEHRPVPSKAYDKKGLVLHCSSFSKTLVPGFRLGWMFPGRFAEKITRIRYMKFMAPNALLQQGVARYLENNRYERHLKKLRRQLSTQMMQTLKAISQYFPADTFTTHPEGGMTLWLQLPGQVDSYRLYQHALAEGIHITPGIVFSTQQEKYNHCIRLSCAEPWSASKEEAVAWLGNHIEHMR